ncbi:MAG: tetratricopeptide repeat protein, partial [Myxococcota bacterium]|nr:tetratricopeptide repeat protein [Myxococcota bacterium]
ALLVSRVSQAMSTARSDELKLLVENTGVPNDAAKARAEVADLEDRAVKLDRQNPELLAIKGQRLRLEGNVDGSVTALKQAIAMDNSRAQFHLELAKVLTAKAGGEKDAKAALEQALKTMDSPKLRVMLGDVNRKLGRADDAITEYTKALADPKTKNPEARLALGSLYRERRSYDKAQEQLEKAAQEYVSQPARAAEAYTELGRTFEEKGDRTKADDAYKKALNADVEYAPAYFFYARFLSTDRAAAGKARATAQEYLKREPRGAYAADAQRIVSL